MTTVFLSLLPVVLFIALGFAVAKLGWVQAAGVKDLGNLVFLVLTPALLFRTMSRVDLASLDFGPVLVYFMAVGLMFVAVMLLQGFTAVAAARALACTFGNTIMIGVPFIGLVYGEAGLVHLFTLVAVHSLVLLTSATVVFELASARAQTQAGVAKTPLRHTVLKALRGGLIHPVPVPIFLGLLVGALGLTLPDVLDKPLLMMGQAMGPMALLLVGMTLAQSQVGAHLRMALLLAGSKNLILPSLMLALGLLLGLGGLPLAVMVCAAALPTGANVFLFAQRYNTSPGEITAVVAASTVGGLLSLLVVLVVLFALVPVG